MHMEGLNFGYLFQRSRGSGIILLLGQANNLSKAFCPLHKVLSLEPLVWEMMPLQHTAFLIGNVGHRKEPLCFAHQVGKGLTIHTALSPSPAGWRLWSTWLQPYECIYKVEAHTANTWVRLFCILLGLSMRQCPGLLLPLSTLDLIGSM